jgi:hypothetical protein
MATNLSGFSLWSFTRFSFSLQPPLADAFFAEKLLSSYEHHRNGINPAYRTRTRCRLDIDRKELILGLMKTILMTVLLACALLAGACSRSPQQPDTATQTAPDPNLPSDAQRLQEATAKAAAARKREAAPPESPAPSAPQP